MPDDDTYWTRRCAVNSSGFFPATSKTELITALLNYFGWEQRSINGTLYEVWSPSEGSPDEVIVPLDPMRGDFESLSDRAYQSILARYGYRAQQVGEVLETRLVADLTPICWKKETAEVSGIIDWDQGVNLYESARSQLSAAAKSAQKRKKYHGNSRAFIANELLSSTFMGQTDFGSFVITAYVPRNKHLFTSKGAKNRNQATVPEMPLDPKSVVPSEEVLQIFNRSLRAVREGLDSYAKHPSVELFMETVQEGVSFELVRSLADMVSTGATEISIGHTYSEMKTYPDSIIAFVPMEVPVLRKVQNELVRTAEPEYVTLCGEVTLLSKEDGDQTHRVVRINLRKGDPVRKVKVRLTEKQHEIALEAYQRNLQLSVTGKLERDGQTYWLYNVEDVDIRNADNSSNSSGADETIIQHALIELSA